MMKKFLLIISLILICSTARAEIDLNLDGLNLPDIKSGAIYMMDGDKDVEFSTMATILKYEIPKVKMKLDLDAIYTLKDAIGAGISLEIGSLANLAGVELALAKILDLSVGVGMMYDFSAEDYGFGVYTTAVKVKF